jgi:hypothetical protein
MSTGNAKSGTPKELGKEQSSVTFDNQSELPPAVTAAQGLAARQALQRAAASYQSMPPEGSILTGKQEHCTFFLYNFNLA